MANLRISNYKDVGRKIKVSDKILLKSLFLRISLCLRADLTFQLQMRVIVERVKVNERRYSDTI